MTKLQFEMASLKKPQINFVGLEIDDEEVHTDDIVKKLEAKLRSKEEMLNEAVLEFHTKSEELNKVQQESESLKLKNAQTLEEITNLQVKPSMLRRIGGCLNVSNNRPSLNTATYS